MSVDKPFESKSLDPAVQQMIAKAKEKGIATVWDRYEAMTPQCGYGDTGLCCRNCLQGPCRINLFGDEPKTGICGSSADVMVARWLDRAIAAGTAAHSGHAKHLAHTMMKMAKGQAPDYTIKDPAKLRSVAVRLGLPVQGRDDREIARDVASAALADFGEKETPVQWAATVVTEGRVKALSKIGAVPKGIDHEVSEIMHRTLYGVDADALVKRLVYGVGTGLITSRGDPALDGVYKLTSIERGGKQEPAIKLSETPEKSLTPGEPKTCRRDDREKAR